MSDIDTLVADPAAGPLDPIVIDGVPCVVGRIGLRQFFKICQIAEQAFREDLWAFLGAALGDDANSTAARFTALLVKALPEAEDQAIALLASMVAPVDPAHTGRVRAAMVNPDPIAALDILARVCEQEGPHIFDLLGKAGERIEQITATIQQAAEQHQQNLTRTGDGRGAGSST